MVTKAPVAQVAAGAGAGNARSALVNFAVRGPRTNPLQELGASLESYADLAQENAVRADNLRSVEAEGTFQKRVTTGIQDLDPLAPDYRDQVERVYSESAEAVQADTEFTTRQVAEEFQLRLKEQSNKGSLLAIVNQREALAEDATRRYGEAADETLADIRQDPDGADDYLAAFAGKTQRLNDAIPPESRRKLAEAFGDDALVAQIEGLALAGRYDEAKEAADANQGDLTTEAFRGIKRRIREIENTARQDELAATAKTVADIEIRIDDETTVSGLDRLRREIDVLQETGLFEGRQGTRSSLVKQINTARERLLKQDAEVGSALKKFDSGTGVDTQREADQVWGLYQGKIADNDPQAVTQHVAEFTARSGFVPTAYKRLLENAERAESPETLASAAVLYRDISKKAPEVDYGLPATGSRVRLTAAAIDLLGIAPQEASQLILDRIPDRATLDARRKQFEEDFGVDFDARDTLQNEDLATTAWFSDDAVISEAAARDYEKMLRLHYDLSGDETLAKTAAARRFREVYGETRVGGELRVAKHAPERFFPGATNTLLDVKEKSRVLDGDLKAHLDAYGIKPAIVVGAEEATEDGGVIDASGIPPYALAADTQTERDLARGQRPTYEVRVRNAYGILVPQRVTLPDGSAKILRYRMPTLDELQATPEYQAIVSERDSSAVFWRGVGRLTGVEAVSEAVGVGATAVADWMSKNVEVGPVQWQNILPDLQRDLKLAKKDAERLAKWIEQKAMEAGKR